jgi:hypothetical protein
MFKTVLDSLTHLCFYLKLHVSVYSLTIIGQKYKIIKGMQMAQCTEHHNVFLGSHTFYNVNINNILPLLEFGYYRPCIILQFDCRTKVM